MTQITLEDLTPEKISDILTVCKRLQEPDICDFSMVSIATLVVNSIERNDFESLLKIMNGFKESENHSAKWISEFTTDLVKNKTTRQKLIEIIDSFNEY
jgi:NRPS condensation-like uncharacterized protein